MQGVLVDALISDAQQRQSFFPRLLALLTIGDRDSRVAIVVAIDAPFEAERQQRRRFGDEFLDGGLVCGKQRRSPQQCQ